MKRAFRFLKWVVTFPIWAFLAVVAMPLAEKCAHAQDPPEKHSIRSSVRPNDSNKFVASLPWVSEYEPPAIYEEWWKEIAACEGLPYPGELTHRVKWVEINSVTFRVGAKPEETFGFTDAPRLTIYVALGSQLDPEVILHEMAHQLDWWAGIDEGEDYHPPDTFENCHLHRFHK